MIPRSVRGKLNNFWRDMGHSLIGTMPATRRWKDVSGLVAEGAEVSRRGDYQRLKGSGRE